jgi:hypothetical protein
MSGAAENTLTTSGEAVVADSILTLRRVGDLNVHIGDKVYRFAPEKVTDGQMPYLLQLFTVLIAQSRIGAFDVEAFVLEHQLLNCFEVK